MAYIARNFTPIDGATASVANTAGQVFNIGRAEKVVFEFKRAAHGSGSSAFGVEVSNDGTNFIQYNKLIKSQTNANTETLVRSGTVTLGSNTTEIYTMSPEDTFEYCRIYVTETTDGTHTARITIFE